MIHGDKYGFGFRDAEGNETDKISVNERAKMIKRSGAYKGGAIRLISCEAAADGSLVAQALADELGVTVMAPSDVLWVNEKGEITIGETPLKNTGEWRIIKPKREVKK